MCQIAHPTLTHFGTSHGGGFPSVLTLRSAPRTHCRTRPPVRRLQGPPRREGPLGPAASIASASMAPWQRPARPQLGVRLHRLGEKLIQWRFVSTHRCRDWKEQATQAERSSGLSQLAATSPGADSRFANERYDGRLDASASAEDGGGWRGCHSFSSEGT